MNDLLIKFAIEMAIFVPVVFIIFLGVGKLLQWLGVLPK